MSQDYPSCNSFPVLSSTVMQLFINDVNVSINDSFCWSKYLICLLCWQWLPSMIITSITEQGWYNGEGGNEACPPWICVNGNEAHSWCNRLWSPSTTIVIVKIEYTVYPDASARHHMIALIRLTTFPTYMICLRHRPTNSQQQPVMSQHSQQKQSIMLAFGSLGHFRWFIYCVEILTIMVFIYTKY